MEIHFVYAGYKYYDYFGTEYQNRLKSIIRDGMKKYKIENVMLTIIYLYRDRLLTKEEMENYCKGNEGRKQSVNDDLDSFVEKIRLGDEPLSYDDVWTYFLPKLTEKELELVDRKDDNFMNTFEAANPDVEKAKMAASESDSKFVKGCSRRRTFKINN